MNVRQFLVERGVTFDLVPHREAYDAQRIAHAMHVPGQDFAKTVMLRVDDGFNYVVAVMPAHKRIDFDQLSGVLAGCKLELATEIEITSQCPDCELGVVPPFGSQYDMKTIVDTSLVDDDEITFEGNNHHEAIRIRFEDYRNLENPMMAQFAV